MTEENNAVKAEIGREPYEIASQIKLFKAGLLGTAVTVWSSYAGGYGPTQLMMKEDHPVIIPLDSDDVDDQVEFAGGYIYGWVEKLGGDPDKLEIWLAPHAPA